MANLKFSHRLRPFSCYFDLNLESTVEEVVFVILQFFERRRNLLLPTRTASFWVPKSWVAFTHVSSDLCVRGLEAPPVSTNERPPTRFARLRRERVEPAEPESLL